MLCLSRKVEEAVVIGPNVTVKILEIRADKVRLGITAPREIEVDREEVRISKEAERKARSAC